jgi:hypothetical protein
MTYFEPPLTIAVIMLASWAKSLLEGAQRALAQTVQEP